MVHKVEIYSTPTCGYCHMAKAFFDEHKVEYTEHDVYTDTKAREEMITKSGQMGVPVIIIDDEIVVGFNQPKIAEMLEIK